MRAKRLRASARSSTRSCRAILSSTSEDPSAHLPNASPPTPPLSRRCLSARSRRDPRPAPAGSHGRPLRAAAAAAQPPAAGAFASVPRSACNARISSPERPGRDYQLTPYLEALQELRNDFTVISGLSHPGVDGGHTAEASYLTAAPHPGSHSFRNTISLDQFAAEQLVRRYALCLARPRRQPRRQPLLHPQRRAHPRGRSARRRSLRAVPRGHARGGAGRGAASSAGPEHHGYRHGRKRAIFSAASGKRDREKLDEYFTTVREVEARMVKGQDWARKPKPKVDAQAAHGHHRTPPTCSAGPG